MTPPLPPFSAASFPEMYERWLVRPLFLPWAELMLDRLRPAPGEGILDVACGTGVVARLAKERLGDALRVVGVDLSPAMLGVARGVAPGIDWREGNAGALPVRDPERFDVVVCQQGLQFFPDKPAAAREMHRVLAPGGRLGVAVWRSDEEMPFLRALRGVAERHVGPVMDARHGFPEASALETLLTGAGFHDVRIERVSLPIRFDDGEMFIRLNAMAMVGMSARGKELDDEARARTVATIVAESAELAGAAREGKGLMYELGANVATARS